MLLGLSPQEETRRNLPNERFLEPRFPTDGERYSDVLHIYSGLQKYT